MDFVASTWLIDILNQDEFLKIGLLSSYCFGHGFHRMPLYILSLVEFDTDSVVLVLQRGFGHGFHHSSSR